jgi:predicted GH43/DUF377 family glycosyl hydrolase
MQTNLVKHLITQGGRIKPLLIPSSLTNGTGLCNPSIFVDGEDILVNIRHVGYNLYHSEKTQKYPSWHGPLLYLHPEDDLTLRTDNYLGKLNEDLDIKYIHKVDTSTFDTPPQWEFIGLEDIRIIKWDNKLYLSGVRRDVKPNGEGRIELSEIDFTPEYAKELSRKRIQPPDTSSYCEKNWMPILDREYEYVKWTNPTEIVKINLETSSATQTIFPNIRYNLPRDIRGGSQVIRMDKYYVALIHEVELWKNETGYKDAQYYHRFIVWDEDFKIVHTSQEFKFMDGQIEFACGMACYKDKYLITFGFQDNAAFILEVPKIILENFIVYGK